MWPKGYVRWSDVQVLTPWGFSMLLTMTVRVLTEVMTPLVVVIFLSVSALHFFEWSNNNRLISLGSGVSGRLSGSLFGGLTEERSFELLVAVRV